MYFIQDLESHPVISPVLGVSLLLKTESREMLCSHCMMNKTRILFLAFNELFYGPFHLGSCLKVDLSLHHSEQQWTEPQTRAFLLWLLYLSPFVVLNWFDWLLQAPI